MIHPPIDLESWLSRVDCLVNEVLIACRVSVTSKVFVQCHRRSHQDTNPRPDGITFGILHPSTVVVLLYCGVLYCTVQYSSGGTHQVVTRSGGDVCHAGTPPRHDVHPKIRVDFQFSVVNFFTLSRERSRIVTRLGRDVIDGCLPTRRCSNMFRLLLYRF